MSDEQENYNKATASLREDRLQGLSIPIGKGAAVAGALPATGEDPSFQAKLRRMSYEIHRNAATAQLRMQDLDRVDKFMNIEGGSELLEAVSAARRLGLL